MVLQLDQPSIPMMNASQTISLRSSRNDKDNHKTFLLKEITCKGKSQIRRSKYRSTQTYLTHSKQHDSDAIQEIKKKFNQIICISKQIDPCSSRNTVPTQRTHQSSQNSLRKGVPYYDENNIIDQYWTDMEKEQKLSKFTLQQLYACRLRSRGRPNLLDCSKMNSEMACKQSDKANIYQSQSQRQSPHTKRNGLVIRPSANNNALIRDFSQQRQLQLLKLTKNKIENQNASFLYSMIKGGYSRDPTDLEGECISLKHFRQAKQNFNMLRCCYEKVVEDTTLLSFGKAPLEDGAFRTLVYLNEVNDRLSKLELGDLMKRNRVIE